MNREGSRTSSSSKIASALLEPITVTVDEAARMLGVNRKAMYAAIARDEVPGVIRVGRALRIGREALLRWAGCQPPADSENG